MRDERTTGLDPLVEFGESVAASVNAEVPDDPYHLPEEVDDGGAALRRSPTGCGPITKSVSSRTEPAPTCSEK